MKSFLSLVAPFILAFFLSSCGKSSGGAGGTPAIKHIFLSSTTYNGNLGGLTGADQKCAALAAGGTGLGTSWKAWLSDSTTNAIDRISDVGPWYLVDGTTKVFNNKANLQTVPLAAINQTELGATPGEGNFAKTVWTNTDLGGAKISAVSANTCTNWTDSTAATTIPTGNWGFAADAKWTNNAANDPRTCQQPFSHIYCIEQ